MRLISAAAILAAPLAPAAASDPSCPDGYTGYSLKVGSACAQYVYCQGGTIGGWHSCPGSLTYTGDVGGGAGICDWPSAANVCKDPALLEDEKSGGSANTAAAEDEGAAASEPSALQQLVESSSGKFCGRTKADAAASCLPCVQNLCNSPDHACFHGISACGGEASAGGSQQQEVLPEMVMASNLVARPCASISLRNRPIPTFFALPHSDACNDTSIPVGSRPRNDAMISQDPSGVSSWKKCTNSAIGAGSTTKTANVHTMRIPAAILVASSTIA